MKCEGGADPPCVRCRKAKRECHPQVQYRRRTISESVLAPIMNSNTIFEQQSQGSVPVSASSDTSQQSPCRNYVGPNQSRSLLPGMAKCSSFVPPSTLPSIYSSPPMTLVSSSHADIEDDRESRVSLPPGSAPLSQNGGQDFLIPLNDLRDMTELQVH